MGSSSGFSRELPGGSKRPASGWFRRIAEPIPARPAFCALAARNSGEPMSTAFASRPTAPFFRPPCARSPRWSTPSPTSAHEIFLVCERRTSRRVSTGCPPRLRERIKLLTLDFSRYDKRLAGKGRFSRAVFRRLFLAELLPAHVERIVSVDSDMLIVRPGLSRLARFDFGGRPLAAAYDMIFLMDFKGDDALVRQFRRSRRALGLALETPYFNAGLMAIDRAAWRPRTADRAGDDGAREDPKRYPFMEQDALNATLKGVSRRCRRATISWAISSCSTSSAASSRSCCILSTRRSPGAWRHGKARRALRRATATGSRPRRGRTGGGAGEPLWRRSRPARTRLRQAFGARLSAFLEKTPFLDR